MKINTSMLWEDKAKSEVTYTTYLIEKTPDIKNKNPRPAVIICGVYLRNNTLIGIS